MRRRDRVVGAAGIRAGEFRRPFLVVDGRERK